ncbi:unnamed protein product, partial [Polarella glacialis]
YSVFTDLLLKKGSKVTVEPGEGGPEEGAKARTLRHDKVNNAFFSWQLTHESEQEDVGHDLWPELYAQSQDFMELKRLVKLACLEYLRQIYAAPLSAQDLAQLELSIW